MKKPEYVFISSIKGENKDFKLFFLMDSNVWMIIDFVSVDRSEEEDIN